ncbi:MAG: hypothetical protein KGL12_05120 [Rhodospirillales bacterium]|nr:hypothetical protein [Rhodospirillales bacterium]
MRGKPIMRRAVLSSLPLLSLLAATAQAAPPAGLLETIHRHATLASTVPANGDLNPYAIAVAPSSVGAIAKGDVLVTNFNNVSNLQGTGTSIVRYSPATGKLSLFADLPAKTPGCPGGIGLSTALAVLRSGWVIVGSAPSTDGTTKTLGQGCLLVLGPDGKLAATWTGPDIVDPWGNIALRDDGDRATLFVSMAGKDVPGPEARDGTGKPVVVHKASVLRLRLAIPAGKPPRIAARDVVADGFGQRADAGAFLIGPTGLALAGNGTLYVSDALANRIVAIPDALTRADSAGTGKTVTQGGLLRRPLAMAMTPGGHLLVTNALNGQVVEVDPAAGKQVYAQWIVTDQAQTPPGNGDLFGIAMNPAGTGFYYVADDVNTLMEARP